MALPVRTQVKIWGAAAVVAFLVLWLLGNVLVPFLVAAAIAYMLDPLADRLQRLGLSRLMATLVITAIFLCLAVVMVVLVVPALIRQAAELAEAVPRLIVSLRGVLRAHFPEFANIPTLAETFPQLGETVGQGGAGLLRGLLGSALNIVNLVALFVIVPVVSVYLLLDWDRMVAVIDDLLPRDYAPIIRQLAREIDETLSGFLRGQGLVCLIQGTFYAIALMLAGLQYGLFVGAMAGLLSFIPFVGSIVGGVLAIGLAALQFWGDPAQISLIAAIFMFGQIVEGNFLTPKLVGGSVGLHPVWLMLAMAVFGTLFGFVGLLAAVPVSAMIGVVVRFAMMRYRTARLYLGELADDKDEPPEWQDISAE